MNEPLPKTMKAVRLHGVGFENITVDEVPVPEPNDNQLLARVDAAGVCTSILKEVEQGGDHTLINGWDLERYPRILGDEGCVTIVKAGRNVADRFPVGKRYATQPAVDVPPINHRERYRHQGRGMFKVAVGYTLPGHLSEYMLIPEEVIEGGCLLPVPGDDVPSFAGALCEPLSCCISAQQRHLHISQDGPAAPRVPHLGLLRGGVTMVVGSGAMGRLHAEAALSFEPRHLIVSDIDADRLNWVRDNLCPRGRKGHVEIHAALAGESEELLNKLSDGRGADDIIVAVGHRQTQIDAQQWLAKGGVLNLFGGLKRGEHVIDLDSLRVHYDEIKVVGSSGGCPWDVAEALRLVAGGEFDTGPHLDCVGSLDQFSEALRRVRDHEADGKNVLYPQIEHTPLMPANGWGVKEERDFIAARSK